MTFGRDVTVVVNGEELRYSIHPSEEDLPVRMLTSMALVDSENTGRAMSDWEMRYSNGHRIPPTKTIACVRDFVYLTLNIGVGGCVPRAIREYVVENDILGCIDYPHEMEWECADCDFIAEAWVDQTEIWLSEGKDGGAAVEWYPEHGSR